MKTFIILLVIALLPVLYFLREISTPRQDSIHADVQAKLAEIQAALDRNLERRLCVDAGPFPYSNRRDARGCDRCAALEGLGLLDRSVVEEEPGRPLITYSLNGEGAERYVEGGRFDARLCFGTARVHKILAASPPDWVAGSRIALVKYQVAVDDPDPRLFEERGRALRLDAPAPGTPALYPPECVSVVFLNDGSIDLSDMQVLRWPCGEIWGGKP